MKLNNKLSTILLISSYELIVSILITSKFQSLRYISKEKIEMANHYNLIQGIDSKRQCRFLCMSMTDCVTTCFGEPSDCYIMTGGIVILQHFNGFEESPGGDVLACYSTETERNFFSSNAITSSVASSHEPVETTLDGIYVFDADDFFQSFGHFPWIAVDIGDNLNKQISIKIIGDLNEHLSFLHYFLIPLPVPPAGTNQTFPLEYELRRPVTKYFDSADKYPYRLLTFTNEVPGRSVFVIQRQYSEWTQQLGLLMVEYY